MKTREELMDFLSKFGLGVYEYGGSYFFTGLGELYRISVDGKNNLENVIGLLQVLLKEKRIFLVNDPNWREKMSVKELIEEAKTYIEEALEKEDE